MKTTIKAFLLVALVLLALLAFPFFTSAQSAYEVECSYAEYADAIYFYSYDAKSVLYSKNAEKIVSPASTVKIMTGLIACEWLETRLDESVAISADMLEGHGGTSMGLKVGEVYKIRDLLYGAICGGCNDASQAIAVICSGSINAFVSDMNDYATELEMLSTIYKNPTGLDESGAQTTALDVAILSKSAVKNSLYMQISSAKSYTYNKSGKDTVIYNRNALISHFNSTQYLNEYASGLNSGSTDKGGYVLSTYATSEGTSYLCIVMGAQNEDGDAYSYKIANELINGAISKFERVKVFSANERVSSLPVDCALSTNKEIEIKCITESDVYAFIPKDTSLKKLEYRVYLHDTDLTAPISEGDVLGGMNVYLDGVLIGSTRVISATGVEANGFLVFMKDMRGFFLSRYFGIFLLISIPSIAIYLYFDYMRNRRRNVRYIKF